ncbi:LON peptidase substrate-binding domain-containing protein [Candidatus Viridilinea mediisalina]|uniref:Peptidase S16 n=1 Tax=Candidatus Viridilinea mediisalina TaxID=2024553 RepID=A0A2A6RH22_9CHLR|nr:LON peptidase substrate-binding domain-containing protein [Candidatus Viridilinea mediisalina]PDW02367.1 peptidase S16 [Candidatus Viridilinea mediisalina]
MTRQIPLFPLGTILFPGATINLHIFEERYRMMIGRCLEEQIPFGIVLIRQGDEVLEGRSAARSAEPYLVGTMAVINAHLRLDDGRFLITAIGQERFRIQTLLQESPYLVASVTPLPEEDGKDSSAAASELRSIYERYWQAVSAATGATLQPEDLPDDPNQLAYHLADRLQVTLDRKQRWLEGDLLTRIREIANDLRAELALMPSSQRRPDEGLSGMNSLN